MKTRTAFLAAALLAATTLTGVLPSAAADEAKQSVLRLDEVPVGELDPGKASDYADSMLMFNVYDTLVLPKQGGPGYVPDLAKSWKRDGNDYVFALRDNVKFASGNALRPEDVVFSLDRMKAIGQGLSFLFKNVESAKVVDDHTVRFQLTQPYAPFIAALIRLPIVDKKLVMQHLGDGDGEMKDWGQGWLATHAAGSGAYTVVSHNPQSETVMEKNKDYFLGVPDKAPDQVRLRYGLEASTVRTMIPQGKHDISSQWLPPEVLKSLAANGAQLLSEKTGGAFYIKMNTAKPPLDDVNCRLALSEAYDYAAGRQMVAISKDVSQGSPSTGAIPVGMYGANPISQPLKRDLDAAKKHLAACKYKPSDFTLEISWIGAVPVEERYALLMQAKFAEIGIKSEIKKVPWALFTEQVTKPENTPNISQVFVNAVTGDPDTLLYAMYNSDAAGTWQSPEYLKDDKVDKYLEEGRTATTPEAREKAYSALNDRLMQLAPTIYAYDQRAVFAASDRVKVPALSDPSKAFGVAGMGFTFRLMEMTGK